MIIIGTGAGGGTLAHRLAPSGKRILLLERGGYLPREPENWDSKEVFGKERYLPDENWIDEGRRALQPAPAVLRRRQHQVLRRDPVPPARARLRRGAATTAASRPPGRSPTTTSSPTTPRPSGSTSCTARPARTRPSRRARALPVPGRLARAAHPAAPRRLRADRPPAVPPAGRRGHGRDGPRGGPLRALRPLRRLPLPHRRQGRRARLCVRPALKHDNVTLRTTRKVERLETDRAGGTVTEVVVDRRGARESYSADVVVVSCGAINSAALLLRSASDQHPNGLANSSDQVGPQLHGPHQLGRDRDLADAEPDQVPEDARRQRLLLGRRGLGAPARAHPDARQVGPQHPARGRALVRARAGARLHGQARDRLLAHDRGPARTRTTG